MRVRDRREGRCRRHLRIRKKISGTADRPRMAIMRSNRHIHVQFVDDELGVTLASVSTVQAEKGKNVKAALELGKRAAAVALGKGYRMVVVDRGGFKYHGRIKAVVDGMMAAGVRISDREAPPKAKQEEK